MTVRMRSSAAGNMKSCKTPSPEACSAKGPDGQKARRAVFADAKAASQWNDLSATLKEARPASASLRPALLFLEDSGGPLDEATMRARTG